ncbi:hypothetical protein MUO83_04265 [Candidatus Bathyarchaeota archaeon]|jgi:hypothetical protein|nr:hypothetical protein [Candidatus Bathyarchaeota archaeon]
MSEGTVKFLEKEVKEELRNLALEVVGSVGGGITYNSVGGLAFNFEKRVKEAIVIQFRWTLAKCKFELWDISENGESKTQEYKNGQYENESLVKKQLHDRW